MDGIAFNIALSLVGAAVSYLIAVEGEEAGKAKAHGMIFRAVTILWIVNAIRDVTLIIKGI